MTETWPVPSIDSSPTSGAWAASTSASRPHCGCWCAIAATPARRPARPAHRGGARRLLGLPAADRIRAASITSSACAAPARLGGDQRAVARLAAADPAPPRRPRRGSRSCSTSPGPLGCSTRPPRLPDNARARPARTDLPGIFALCYGLGLRAGEACGLRLGDVDTRPRPAGRARRQVRQDPARPARPTHRRADRRAARAPPRRRRGRR